jgi:hypothetical protein
MDRPDGHPPHRPTGASLLALVAVVVTVVTDMVGRVTAHQHHITITYCVP